MPSDHWEKNEKKKMKKNIPLVAQFENVLIQVLDDTKHTIRDGDQAARPRMCNIMALCHDLAEWFMEADFCSSAARYVVTGILIQLPSQI